MIDILSSATGVITIALAVVAILYTAFTGYYISRRNTKYDTERHRIELEMLRQSLEGQMYSLNEKLTATDARWRDVNHLLISSQNSQRSEISDNPPLSFMPLLEGAGISPNEAQVDPNLIFVLTPFHSKYKQQFEAIAAVCRDFKFKVLRGDEQFIEGDVFPHILSLLVRARLIIANIDGRNPNVLYELGIAHGLGKPTILIARTPGEVPFDVRAKRLVLYEDLGELRRKLRDELARAIVSPSVRATNPTEQKADEFFRSIPLRIAQEETRTEKQRAEEIKKTQQLETYFEDVNHEAKQLAEAYNRSAGRVVLELESKGVPENIFSPESSRPYVLLKFAGPKYWAIRIVSYPDRNFALQFVRLLARDDSAAYEKMQLTNDSINLVILSKEFGVSLNQSISDAVKANVTDGLSLNREPIEKLKAVAAEIVRRIVEYELLPRTKV